MAAPPAPPPLLLAATAAIASLVILLLVVFACRRWWRLRRSRLLRGRRAVEAAAPPPDVAAAAPVPSCQADQNSMEYVACMQDAEEDEVPRFVLSSKTFSPETQSYTSLALNNFHHMNEDLNRPLLENLDDYSSQCNNFPGNVVGESSKVQTNRSNTSPRSHGISDSVRVYPAESCAAQGETHVIDVTNDTSEEFQLGSTLKCTKQTSWSRHDKKHIRSGSRDDNQNGSISLMDNIYRSNLDVEVIAGPSHGISCSRQSTSTTIPITLGRVPPSDLVLKDSEVSGKHARINWNAKTLKWEIVDMGSLNGTFLNSRAVHHPNVGSRHWGEPTELADGDIITLGISSKLYVKISLQNQRVPAGIGMASDPMVGRRSGKKLVMEDISFCQCPLQGVEQFGLFGIFDGHGGDGAARAVSKFLPENLANLLSHHETKEKVLSYSDASDVLRYAFSMTEAAIVHEYEGCTATAMLIWFDKNKDCFVQCANLGDSASVMSVNGKMIEMTEDHRVVSSTERARIARTGQALKAGEVRLNGLNLARMFGDKFLKEQDSRFSSEPYVSQAVHITKGCTAFAVIASDGLWDVISTKRAVQLLVEGKERNSGDSASADKVANLILSEARNLRTKDNTSVIFVDFDILRTDHCIAK